MFEAIIGALATLLAAYFTIRYTLKKRSSKATSTDRTAAGRVIPSFILGFHLTHWRNYGAVLAMAKNKVAKSKMTKEQMELYHSGVSSFNNHRKHLDAAAASLELPKKLIKSINELHRDFLDLDCMENVRMQLCVHLGYEEGPICYGAFFVGYSLGQWEFILPMFNDTKEAKAAADNILDTVRDLSSEGQMVVHSKVTGEITDLVFQVGHCSNTEDLQDIWETGCLRIIGRYYELYAA